MPRFSIVIPCYNARKTITQTLTSLCAQHYTDWEAICVDDGSTDATKEIVLNIAERDPRIKLVQNPGKGPSQARNYGASEIASGQLIAFCDADDLWSPSKLSDLQTAFIDPSLGGAYGRTAFFTHHPSDAEVFSTLPANDLSIDMLLGENPVCTMSNVTIRTEVFAASGGFDHALVHNEDLEWLIRIVGQGARIVGINNLHTWYRASTDGLSADLASMKEARKSAIETASRYGATPSGKSHAIHQRYLSRRALRLNQNRFEPLRHAICGVAQSPIGFLFPLRRGGLTFLAALSVIVLPKQASNRFFSK
ncbi:MAG: glycosyltransferase family 2 protein [Roseobacter sp.]